MTALAQRQGIAFSPDGIHMIVVGEDPERPSAITVYARTRIVVSNDEMDFFNSTTGSPIDVSADGGPPSVVGEAIATGDAEIAVNVSVWFDAWDEQAAFGAQSGATGDRDERNNRYLHASRASAITEPNGTALWSIVYLENGKVHVINAADGAQLDVHDSWATPVMAIDAPEPLDNEWVLRSQASGSSYITNAQYTSGRRERSVNVRTTYRSRPSAQFSPIEWSNCHTNWHIESPT